MCACCALVHRYQGSALLAADCSHILINTGMRKQEETLRFKKISRITSNILRLNNEARRPRHTYGHISAHQSYHIWGPIDSLGLVGKVREESLQPRAIVRYVGLGVALVLLVLVGVLSDALQQAHLKRVGAGSGPHEARRHKRGGHVAPRVGEDVQRGVDDSLRRRGVGGRAAV